MTKREFMRELAGLLSRIPEDERNDALQYYEDYFADAGISDDMLVPASVGTPKQVADKIIGEAIYGESPDQSAENPKDVPITKEQNERRAYYENQDQYYENRTNSYSSNQKDRKQTDNTKLIIGLIIAIVTFPIWVGIVVGIAGLLFGILAGLAGMIIGFGVAGIALVVTAFLSGSIAAGILLAGTGLLLLALAIVMVIPLVMYCGQFMPWLVKELIRLVKKILGKKE